MDNQETTPTTENSNPVNETQSVVTTASMIFGANFQHFVALANKASNNTLRRVLIALVGNPLESVPINLKRDEERQLYSVGQRLMEAKTVLILNTLYQKHQELNKLDTTESEETQNVQQSEKGTQENNSGISSEGQAGS